MSAAKLKVAVCIAGAVLLVAGAAAPAGPTAAQPPKAVTGQAASASLGSPDFHPSPERPFGWRGDGTGRFPGAAPPRHWGRVATSVRQLRSQASRPKQGETGTPIPDGVIRQWLVLGPVSTDREQDLVKPNPGGTGSGPDKAEKAGGISWKQVDVDSSLLDFHEILGPGRPGRDLAFAHAYLYSDAKVKVRLIKEIDLVRGGSSVKTFVNGTPVDPGEFTLEKGWNRLLLRVPCGGKIGPDWLGDKAVKKLSWFVQPILYGAPGGGYATENILWTTRVPGWGIAAPVIAGSRVFAVGQMRTLSCLDKSSGRIIWARTATLYDASTEEERAKNPEIFGQIAPMVSRLAELDKGFASGGVVTGKAIGEKCDLEVKIDQLMRRVDQTKYNLLPNVGDGGYAPRTPVTDGRNVCVNYHPCLTVCYDLDGNRKWVHSSPILRKGETHGWYSSPGIIAGKVIVNAEQAIALDIDTGKAAWQFPEDANVSVLGKRMGSRAVVLLGGTVRDAKSGELLARLTKLGPLQATPVIDGDRMYSLRCYTDPGSGQEILDISRLAPRKGEMAKTITVSVAKLITMQRLETLLASPLVHKGLLYMVDADGILSVVDVAKQEVVYQKYLDLDNGPGGVSRGALGGSPALAGPWIYVFGNQGTCLVIEPGRTYKQIAKNRIEFLCQDPDPVPWNILAAEFPYQMIGGLEQSISCPVFDGKRMYCRGTVNLYCIEEK